MARIFYYGLKTRLNSQGDEIYGSDDFCDAKFQVTSQPWNIIGINMSIKYAEEFLDWVVIQTNYFIVVFPAYSISGRKEDRREFIRAEQILPKGRGRIIERLSKNAKN